LHEIRYHQDATAANFGMFLTRAKYKERNALDFWQRLKSFK